MDSTEMILSLMKDATQNLPREQFKELMYIAAKLANERHTEMTVAKVMVSYLIEPEWTAEQRIEHAIELLHQAKFDTMKAIEAVAQIYIAIGKTGFANSRKPKANQA